MGLLKRMLRQAFRPVINKAKGAEGERRVSAALNPLLFGKVEHRQINNLMLLDENGKTHQIDHVEIRHNGIFCIETKNYSGWIFGGESQPMWTQSLYREKHQLPNPIKQNKSHIYHLNQVLGGKYKINSVIVMVQNNSFRIDVPFVVDLCDLKRYLSNFNDGTYYSTEEMDEIYNTLLNAQTKISNRTHLENIAQTQRDLALNICPRCGGELVLRQGKYGEFYGCSNYPNCKFIKK